MRVLFWGAGAVGCYYGARLANVGVDVTLLCRGEHFQVSKRDGLKIIEDGEEEISHAVKIVDRVEECFDIIILSVKLYDLQKAARQSLKHLEPNGVLLSIQNGVESVEMIREVADGKQVEAGSVLVNLSKPRPGVVRHMGKNRVIRFGKGNSLLEALHEDCKKADLQASLVDDAELMLWQKFCRLSVNSGVSCLFRQPLAQVLCSETGLMTVSRAIDEVVEVGKAKGIPLEMDIETKILEGLEQLAENARSSMLLDFDAQRPLELEWLSGAVHKFGQDVGIDTPIHSTIYAALLPFSSPSAS